MVVPKRGGFRKLLYPRGVSKGGAFKNTPFSKKLRSSRGSPLKNIREEVFKIFLKHPLGETRGKKRSASTTKTGKS